MRINGLTTQPPLVAVYEHNYQKGAVIHTGIFASDAILVDKQMQFFLIAAAGLRTTDILREKWSMILVRDQSVSATTDRLATAQTASRWNRPLNCLRVYAANGALHKNPLAFSNITWIERDGCMFN